MSNIQYVESISVVLCWLNSLFCDIIIAWVEFVVCKSVVMRRQHVFLLWQVPQFLWWSFYFGVLLVLLLSSIYFVRLENPQNLTVECKSDLEFSIAHSYMMLLLLINKNPVDARVSFLCTLACKFQEVVCSRKWRMTKWKDFLLLLFRKIQYRVFAFY